MAPANFTSASVWQRFLYGFREAIGGVSVAFRSRRLMGLCAVPMVVHAALFVTMVGVALHYVRHFGTAWSTAGPWQNALWHVLQIVVFGAFVFFALIAAGRIASVLCDPVYDLLSETAETLVAQCRVTPAQPSRGIVAGVLRELGAAILGLVVLGVGAGLISLLNVIPIVGPLLNAALGLVWTWLYLAHEYLSRSLARHGVRPSARWAAVFSNKAVAAGFGAGAWIFLFVPLSSPFIEIGAARLHLKLAAHGLVPSKLPRDVRLRLSA